MPDSKITRNKEYKVKMTRNQSEGIHEKFFFCEHGV